MHRPTWTFWANLTPFSLQCSNCTWRDPGTYQALLYRTKTDESWKEWEFVSVFWRAPPTPTSPHIGFTNWPDAFRLDDGRWVFAYLTHATQYAGARILSFVGACDEAFDCSARARPGRLRGLSVSHSKYVLYDAFVVFVWVRRALNSQKTAVFGPGSGRPAARGSTTTPPTSSLRVVLL
jgi:hypothetical protein